MNSKNLKCRELDTYYSRGGSCVIYYYYYYYETLISMMIGRAASCHRRIVLPVNNILKQATGYTTVLITLPTYRHVNKNFKSIDLRDGSVKNIVCIVRESSPDLPCGRRAFYRRTSDTYADPTSSGQR